MICIIWIFEIPTKQVNYVWVFQVSKHDLDNLKKKLFEKLDGIYIKYKFVLY